MRGPGATMFGIPDETKSKGSSFGIAQAAARCTASNTASRQKRSGKLLGTGVPWGTLIINVTGSFLIGAPVRSQMGLIAGNADIPDSRHLWWLADGKGQLTKTIRQLARRVVKLWILSRAASWIRAFADHAANHRPIPKGC